MKRVKKLPDGWKNSVLVSICQLQAGKFIPASDISDTNNGSLFPCYGGNGLRGFVKKYSHNGTFPLIGRQGALCGNINKATGKFYATEHAVVATPDSNTAVHWLYYKLVHLNLNQYATGAAQPGLSVKNISDTPILLPPLPEQKAIADLLSTWDEAIEKTERLILYKQKLYEAQLSKHLSFNISERIKLKSFLKEVSKRNGKLAFTQVLSVTNSKGFVNPKEQFERQVASDNLTNYKIVSKGEYAYNPSRINVGSIARLDDWDTGVLSPMYTVFKIKKDSELHTDLFLHWLNSHEAKQRIKLSAQGSVRETVSFDDFCSIGFPKIVFNQQKALAEYFNLITEEIDALKTVCEKYITQKRGLMQKLLTGEWRIKPEILKLYAEV